MACVLETGCSRAEVAKEVINKVMRWPLEHEGFSGLERAHKQTLHPILRSRKWASLWGVRMVYRCEAKSLEGFLQQLACCYIARGYHYYVVGEIPEGKDPRSIDARIVDRFGVDISRFARARRKRAGLANAQYIRFRRFFVLLATEPRGTHAFYLQHSASQIRFIKDTPIAFGGYSIGYHRGADRKWHVSVRIHPNRYRNVKAYLLELATKRSLGDLEQEFLDLRFEPYAPVRRQLFSLLRAVNQNRAIAGLPRLPWSCLRLRRRIVRPFQESEATQAMPNRAVVEQERPTTSAGRDVAQRARASGPTGVQATCPPLSAATHASTLEPNVFD